MGEVDIEGLRIHYRAAGSLSVPTGQKVLYVHGTGCDGRVWERHAGVVAGKHTPVCIDLPGHGKSSGAGFRGVADHAYYVVGLADHLGWDEFVVAGHSLGGAIALHVAIYFPERLCGMMLVDTGARLRVDPHVLETARLLASGQNPAAIDPRLGFAKNTPQPVVDAITSLTSETDPKVTYKDWISDDTFDCISRLKAIKTTSIAICGSEDYFTPVKYSEYFRDNLPSCSLQVIEEAGHWTYHEQPQVFDRIALDYLDNLDAQK